MASETTEDGKSTTATTTKLDLWTPYRDLYQKIEQCLCPTVRDGIKGETFHNLLMKHKQNFICLLQNPPKSVKSREELKKGMEDGITIKEIGHQILSRDLYQEAIILSDMYDLNEFVALDLLCTAQVQMTYHFGLPRGLVSVLLYYEGRKFIVSSLKLLVHARKGILWSMNIDSDLQKCVGMFTDQLLECGIFDRIFELLQTLDLTKELEKLQENVALGGPRHQRQIIDLFTDIRQCLAEVVYLWAAQTGLPREPTLGLITYLRQLKPEEDSIGVIDNVTILTLLAVLYAFDLSVLHFREDGEEVIQNLPVLSDPDFISSVNTELISNKAWTNKGLEGVVTLGFAITISGLRRIPQYELPSAITNQKSFLNGSVGTKVFNFLYSKVLSNNIIYSDEIITRRFHHLFTDFIILMFAEVKQLQITSEESMRTKDAYVQEGLEPPQSLPLHFEQFMMCIAKFYAKDPLNLHYCLDYWCPIETNIHELYTTKLPHRSLALYRFIKLSGDSVPGTSFIAFLNMLASLSMHPTAARYCFNLLKQTNHGFNKMLSWDHFFACFNQYYNNLKQEVVHSDTMYRRFQSKGITPQEIDGLLSVLNLIKVIAEHDDFSRLALCEHPVWAPLTVFLGLVGCSVPIHFKASLIFTLAALSKSTEIAAQMWNYIEASQILQTIPTTSRYQPRGIQTELEEIESRIEEYPLTQSFLKLLDVLTDSGIPRTLGAGPRQPGFDPYLTYLVNSVFLKFTSRSYKNQEERWIIGCECLKLFEKFLNNYEPQAIDFTSEFNPPPGFHLMLVLNSKSECLNLILYIIDEGQKLFAQYVSLPGQGAIEKCILHCLNILERSLILQSNYMNLACSSPNPPLLTSLMKLLLLNNPRTGQPDHLICISKYILYYNSLPKHALKIVEILVHVTSSPAIHSQFLNILVTFSKESRAIRNGFVECLDNGETEIKETILKLLKQSLNYATPNFSQFMLGFDVNQDVSQTVFQPAGILNFPRTCLHSVFTILKCSLMGETHFSLTLLENAYEILYILYSNNKTTEPIMRFTRLHPNFFEQHVMHCSKNPKQLVQLSWLFKALAVELKISCDKMQFLHLQALIKFLIVKPRAHNLLSLNTEDNNLLEDLLDMIKESTAAQTAGFVDALRQVIQVLALYLPYEVSSPKSQNITNICLLKKVLEVVDKLSFSADNAIYLSSTAVVLIQNIRRCSKNFSWDKEDEKMSSTIFGYILRWLMSSDAACQNLRIHLYTSLITFLHIAYPDIPKIELSNDTFYVSRLDSSKIQASRHPLAADIPARISKCGDRLIDLICQDCVGGHDVTKMLAMLTFSLFINTSGSNSWIIFMVSRGYLKYIINGILKSDDDLKQLLEPSFENLRVMYLFKAKLSLLLQIASSKVGAELLLEHKIFACLSNMSVLNIHPEMVKQTQLLPERLQDFIPGIDTRYLEIFLPTLELCNATITSLSIDNFNVVTQVLDFVVSQLNAFEFVLRCGSPTLSTDFLHELAIVTSTIALVSRANVAFVAKIQETFQNYNVPMLRIQKHMLSLLSKFLLNENVIQELNMNPPQEGEVFQTSDRLLYTLEITSNLFHYLRNIATNSHTMLFKPSLGTFTLNMGRLLCDPDGTQPPTLGTIVQHLVDFVTYYMDAKNTSTFLKIKFHDIPNMRHADLVDFVKLSYDAVDIEIVRNKVIEFVSDKITKKHKELEYASYIIDNALYLLWTHLDYYMLRAIPRIRHSEMEDEMNYKTYGYGTSEITWNITINDINSIKQGLVPVFNDNFSRQLLETTQGSTEVKRQFVEMLLRKIKRLLQFVPVSQRV